MTNFFSNWFRQIRYNLLLEFSPDRSHIRPITDIRAKHFVEERFESRRDELDVLGDVQRFRSILPLLSRVGFLDIHVFHVGVWLGAVVVDLPGCDGEGPDVTFRGEGPGFEDFGGKPLDGDLLGRRELK